MTRNKRRKSKKKKKKRNYPVRKPGRLNLERGSSKMEAMNPGESRLV